MGCNRTPTGLEAEQIREAATKVAGETGADSAKAERYVRQYGEIAARAILNAERHAHPGFAPAAAFERPNWAPSSVSPASSPWNPPVAAPTPTPTHTPNSTPFTPIAPSTSASLRDAPSTLSSAVAASLPAHASSPPTHAPPQASPSSAAPTPAAPPGGATASPPTTIVQRTAPADSRYFEGPRIIDPGAWAKQDGLVIYRSQADNKVLSAEGWIQPGAFPKGTGSLSGSTRNAISGEHAGDRGFHLSHCLAKCLGGPLLGNLEPFAAEGNLRMSALEKELRAIADEGSALYVQCVFHWGKPPGDAPDRHEIAVFMSASRGPVQVGCFSVDSRGAVRDLPYQQRQTEVRALVH